MLGKQFINFLFFIKQNKKLGERCSANSIFIQKNKNKDPKNIHEKDLVTETTHLGLGGQELAGAHGSAVPSVLLDTVAGRREDTHLNHLLLYGLHGSWLGANVPVVLGYSRARGKVGVTTVAHEKVWLA